MKQDIKENNKLYTFLDNVMDNIEIICTYDSQCTLYLTTCNRRKLYMNLKNLINNQSKLLYDLYNNNEVISLSKIFLNYIGTIIEKYKNIYNSNYYQYINKDFSKLLVQFNELCKQGVQEKDLSKNFFLRNQVFIKTLTI